MADEPKGISIPPVIGPGQGPVTNGTVYRKESLTIEEAARRSGASIPVPNADEIRFPNPNQNLK